MAEWEMNRTTRIIRTLCVACKRVKATRPDHLCDECRARHKGWSMWQHYKGSSKSRGYGYAWSKLRLKALERDRHLSSILPVRVKRSTILMERNLEDSRKIIYEYNC